MEKEYPIYCFMQILDVCLEKKDFMLPNLM